MLRGKAGLPFFVLFVSFVLGSATPLAGRALRGEAAAADEEALDPDTTLAYVGTATGAQQGQGIYVFRLQTRGLEVSQNITLVPLGLAAATPNPTFLEFDQRRRLVFAANEVDDFQGKPSGAVSAFSVNNKTGKLLPLGQRASGGRRPCHLVLDKAGRHLLVANCGSGNLAVIPVGNEGRLGVAAAVPAPAGETGAGRKSDGANRESLTGVALDPANRFAFACQPARDRIAVFRFDAQKGKLAATQTALTLKAGSGPRHLVFRPDGRFAYVANSAGSTVTALAYDAGAGKLREIQTLSTVPEYYEGPNSAAEVDVHPTGKYLYVSNQGHNSVVLYAIDGDKGTLRYIEEQGTGGKTPRHFGIQPSAKHLAIANRDSDTLLVCRIDAGNGRLKPSGVFAAVPAPTCVKFLPPASEEAR